MVAGNYLFYLCFCFLTVYFVSTPSVWIKDIFVHKMISFEDTLIYSVHSSLRKLSIPQK